MEPSQRCFHMPSASTTEYCFDLEALTAVGQNDRIPLSEIDGTVRLPGLFVQHETAWNGATFC